MTTRLFGLCCLLAALLVSGCGQSEKPADSAAKNGSDAESPKIVREDMAGRWLMRITLARQQIDHPLGLLEVTEDEGKYTAEWLAGSIDLEGVAPDVAEATEDSVHLSFPIGEDTRFDVRGRLRDGIVWSDGLFSGSSQVRAVQFLPTEVESLDTVEQAPSEGAEAYSEAGQSETPGTALAAFAESHPSSPLALEAYDRALLAARSGSLSRSEVEEIAKRYVDLAGRWGERMQQKARLDVGWDLAATDYLPDLAREYLDAAEEQLGEGGRESWGSMIESARRNVRALEARLALQSDDEAERQAARKTLEELRAEDPSDPDVTWALADFAREQGRKEDALQLLAEIVALPNVETILVRSWQRTGDVQQQPTDVLESVWKEVHGSSEGLEAFLDETYRKHVYDFAEGEARPAPEGSRVALVELLTGTACPPCLAADVALGAVEQVYDRATVIGLRYHQHNPGPDPLTSEDSEERLQFYEPPGTPAMFVNGAGLSGIGGFTTSHAEPVFERILERVEEVASESTDVSLKLSADVSAGELRLSAAARKLPAGKLRLRMAVAENEVVYPAQNGVRVHEMVVRWMPGGAEGVAAEDGAVVYEETFDLAEMRDALLASLQEFEEGTGYEFSRKPMRLEDLTFVAFVQDDATQEVLQAAAVPVSGQTPSPDADDEPETAGTNPSDAPNTDDPNSDGPKLSLPGKTEDSEDGATTGDDAPALEARKDTAGRWAMRVTVERAGLDFPVGLFEVTRQEDETYSAKWLAGQDLLQDEQPDDVEATKDSVHVRFVLEDGTPFDVQGRFDAGEIRGNALYGDSNRLRPIRFTATTAESPDEVDPAETAGRDDYASARRAEDPTAALLQFAQEHPESPLALAALDRVLLSAAKADFSDERVKEVAQLYVKLAGKWGPRMQQMARLDVGYDLAVTELLPAMAQQYLDRAEKALTDDTRAAWQPMIARARAELHTRQALRMLASDDEATRKQGRERLQGIHEDDPANYEVTHALANLALEEGRKQDALKLLAEIVALPNLELMLVRSQSGEGDESPELPSDQLETLWKEVHGSEKGLDAFVQHVYEERIYAFADEKAQPRGSEEGNRVALFELFTGTKCPPCVAADVALGGLEQVYDKSAVIGLRYHQHNPGPDPLTTPDSEQRYEFYQPLGTPWMYLNGRRIEGAAGQSLALAERGYERLRSAAQDALTEKTDVAIDLAAKVEAGKLNVSAAAKGFDPANGRLRLRLVLAEAEVEFAARNGVRVHEMVVRWMPGGPAGVAPQDGVLEFSATMDPAEMKRELLDALEQFELGSGFQFESKPLPLEKLYLVAFVQDDATQEVLQSAAVPVEGELVFPEAKDGGEPEGE